MVFKYFFLYLAYTSQFNLLVGIHREHFHIDVVFFIDQ